MKVLNSINENKRLAVIIISLVLIGLMFFPIANVRLENNHPNSTFGISLLNASSKIKDIKDKLGINEVDISGIDKSHPKDNIEKTTLVLKEAVDDIDLSVFMGYLAILIFMIGAMVIYIKPNSIFGLILHLSASVSLFLAQILAIRGFDTVNHNIKLFKDYFGLDSSIAGFTFSFTFMYYFIIFISLILLSVDIAFRKPKQANNEPEKLLKSILLTCAVISVLCVFFITMFLLVKGIPTISRIGIFEFLFTSVWDPLGDTPKFGIANLILTSFTGTIGAVIIGVPIGILVAIFISQLTPKKFSNVLSSMVNLLAGIPSVIYGAVGAILLVPFIQKTLHISTGMTLLTAIIVLSVMVLPTIISVSVTSLNAVPNTYMEASLALGLTKEASIFKILIPAARSGIMTGVLLGLGRAIGEAMAIILVAGNVPQFPKLLEPARFLTTGIVAEMGYATGLHRDALFAIGLVLFFFILIINSVFRYFIKKAGEKYEQ